VRRRTRKAEPTVVGAGAEPMVAGAGAEPTVGGGVAERRDFGRVGVD